ncbi:hypothetical protein D3C84_280130 [compost metagenome]
MLTDRQHALLLRRNRYACRGVGMQHARHVVTHFVHRAMDGVAGGVDLVRTVHLLVTGLIDFDQARSGDFVEHHPERIDQEIFGARYLGRNVGEDQIIPAMQGHQPITGGQIHPRLPLGDADLISDIRG